MGFYDRSSFVSAFFCEASCFSDPSTVGHVPVEWPFSLSGSTPLCEHTIIYLPILPLMGIWVTSSLRLLQIVLKQPVFKKKKEKNKLFKTTILDI